jgi:hypothetical protein
MVNVSFLPFREIHPSVDRIILQRIFKKVDGAWTGLVWLWIGTGGGLL